MAGSSRDLVRRLSRARAGPLIESFGFAAIRRSNQVTTFDIRTDGKAMLLRQSYPHPAIESRTYDFQLNEVQGRVRSMVGSWASLTGQWLGVHDLYLDRLVHIEGSNVLGYSAEQLADIDHARGLLHADDKHTVTRVEQAFQRALLECSHDLCPGCCTLTVVHRMRKSDGSYALVQRHAIPFSWEAVGHVRAMLHLCRDYSALAPISATVRWSFEGPEQLRLVFEHCMGTLTEDRWTPTPREHELLDLLAQGFTSQRISELLNISVLTVNGHRRNMLKKSGLPNTAALVQHAFSRGWV